MRKRNIKFLKQEDAWKIDKNMPLLPWLHTVLPESSGNIFQKYLTLLISLTCLNSLLSWCRLEDDDPKNVVFLIWITSFLTNSWSCGMENLFSRTQQLDYLNLGITHNNSAKNRKNSEVNQKRVFMATKREKIKNPGASMIKLKLLDVAR